MLSLHWQTSKVQAPAPALATSKYVQFSLLIEPHPVVTETRLNILQ